MNKEAMELIATWSKGYTLDHVTDGAGDLEGMLRAAMEWAYRDAMKAVDGATDNHLNEPSTLYRAIEAIEARLK